MVELIKVATKIPSQYLPLFPHETFNEMQSYLVDQVLSDDVIIYRLIFFIMYINY